MSTRGSSTFRLKSPKPTFCRSIQRKKFKTMSAMLRQQQALARLMQLEALKGQIERKDHPQPVIRNAVAGVPIVAPFCYIR
jgi:hypothetical protein